jgi:hypothetical protein
MPPLVTSYYCIMRTGKVPGTSTYGLLGSLLWRVIVLKRLNSYVLPASVTV